MAFAMQNLWLLLCLLTLGCSGKYSDAKARDEWISEWETKLENGEHDVWLYSTKNTNVLLGRISGNPNVESLAICQTLDLDEKGLAALATFPQLSTLTISGEKSLNDETIGFVTDCMNLESLELECTAITSHSFPSLVKLRNLTKLNIETCDPNETYADADVLSLSDLKQLRYLNLNGAASPDILQALGDRLPECKISDATSITVDEQSIEPKPTAQSN